MEVAEAVTPVPLAVLASASAAASDWRAELRSLGFWEQLASIKATSQQSIETQRARVPDLVGLLRDPDQSVRVTAAAELAEIRAVAGEAVPALIERFIQPPGEEGSEYVAAVVAFGAQAVPALEVALGHKEWLVRTRACAALRKLQPTRFTGAECAGGL